ncbi:MAG: DUF7009 family protein [Pyrinomonadaceae bacterium]
MKLRIRGNTLRLRLTRSEVDEFASSGRCADKISFGGERALVYAIEKTAGKTVSAVFDGAEIKVSVPGELAHAWTNTDQVGFDAVYRTGDGDELQILVEKDFACLTPRADEDTADNFPHPKTTC